VPKIVANGIATHYRQEGEGEDLVLVHGLTGNLSTWFLHVMPALASRYRVTAYDLRGHGYSEVTPSGYTSADLADDLAGLLDSLAIARAHLVGYSFGATVALHAAALHPTRVASLVLAEPWISALRPAIDLAKWPYREAARQRLRLRGLDIPEERWFDLDFILRQAIRMYREGGLDGPRPEPVRFSGPRPGDPGQPGEVWRSLASHLLPPSRRVLRLIEETSALTQALEVAGLTMDRIALVRQPTLAIYGELSPLLQVADMLEPAMPNCRAVVLKGAGHYFAVINPEQLVESARAFLGGLAPEPSVQPSGLQS
jgi:pimeloyl-ACP methyl ester carboxylesterase